MTCDSSVSTHSKLLFVAMQYTSTPASHDFCIILPFLNGRNIYIMSIICKPLMEMDVYIIRVPFESILGKLYGRKYRRRIKFVDSVI